MEKNIPKKIHFIFLAKDVPMPEIFKYCINRAKELHPDWEINFYNEDNALQIIQNHFPELVHIYSAYSLGIQRAHLLRILLVYLYGGFYMDLDVCCLKNLDPLLKFNIVLGEEKRLTREVCSALGLSNPKRIANYMFGSVPQHPFWLEFLNMIIENSPVNIENENDVLESSGSGLFTDFYHSKNSSYQDIVLLLNNDRFCLNQNHREIACHFGNFAAHMHAGTWRWENGQTPKFDDLVQKKSNTPLDNSFRYKIEKNRNCSFYFNQNTTVDEPVCNKELADTFGKNGIAAKDLTGLLGEKVILYGPVRRYIHENLPANTYFYCSSSACAAFTSEEVYFINNRFRCCIVPDSYIMNQYVLNGISIDIKVLEPGFRRYKRNLQAEHDIEQFKLGCVATSIDSKMLSELLQACRHLQKEHIPSVKIKLYDPYGKFKDLNAEFDEAGIVEYMPVIVSSDYFSSWFSDLALAIFGYTVEPWPSGILEFLYMGVPVIIPDAENYKRVLKTITADPAVIISLLSDSAGLAESTSTVKSIENAILKLYQDYEYHSTNAVNAAKELEDLQTKEETEQNLFHVLSDI